MPVPRLPAKLSRPRSFGTVDRGRLFDELDGQRDRALVWVAGPPGSGKTTLVTSYLARAGSRVLWYRVDEGDGDAATFFNYLGQGAQAATRRRRLALPALTPEYLPDLPGFARRYFRTLFDALPDAGALVLDGYESAPAGALDALVAIAAEELPRAMRLVVTSRAPPPAGLAHLQAKGTLALIPWEALRLTPDEARAIAGDAALPAAASVETLHALCDGWAAGFVVLLEHARRSGTPDPHASGALRESLFAYFVHEMFARADAATRTVLMTTALLPGFTEGEAQALCGQAGAVDTVRRLYRQHYFIERSMDAQPVYRYHALFRDFLLEQGRELLSEPRRGQLLARAGELLEQGGRQEEAVGLYTQARAWAQAGRLIASLAPALLGGGRNATLDRAIGEIPQAVIDATPWLSYWLGMARLPFNPPAGRALLETAYARFEALGDAGGCVLACAGILDSYHFEWTDVGPIDRWVRCFEAHAGEPGAFPTVEIEVRALVSLFVLIFRADAHAALLERVTERALEIIAQTGDPIQRLFAATPVGFVLAARGDWDRMRKLVTDVQSVVTPAGVPPVHLMLWNGFLAWQSQQQGEFAQAYGHIAQAERLAGEHGIRVLEVLIAGQGAHAALCAGDAEKVEHYLRRMRAALRPNRVLDAANCDVIAAFLELVRGRPGAALQHARAGVEKTLAGNAGFLVAESRVALAHALLELGEHAGALAAADAIIAYAAASQHRVFEHAGLMLKADALCGSGRTQEALSALADALRLGRERELVVIFPWAPLKFMQRLFGLALEAGIETVYVRDLIRRLHVPSPPAAGEQWPWPVRIRTLGRFEIMLGEVQVEYSRKLPKRPLALLKFLLSHRGSVRVEQAIDALWPDEEADAAANALDAALHRLRRLLGGARTLELHDGRLSLNAGVIWVDAFAFEQALESAEGTAAQLRRRAFEIYGGHFLAADRAEPWSISTRERLRARFIRTVTAQGQALYQAQEYEAGAEHYVRSIDVDDLVEAFYQGLMRCQLALGLRSEGLATYERLRKTLAAGLGLQPAATSEQLHQALRRI